MAISSTSKVITSRVGRKPIALPSGIDVKLHDHQIEVKGPKGRLTMPIHQFVNVKIENNQIIVQPLQKNSDSVTGAEKKLMRCIVGTVRSNINNLIEGVLSGFEKKLVLVGVGYRAKAEGKTLHLNLGFSDDPRNFPVPEGVTIETPTPTEIIVKGNNNILVGKTAANIREIRPPEPYKGKGVRYANEKIELKETKKK